ncbi:MAG: hypothetical protein ACFFCW_34840 [Candidatus Hodarchaeota archaeon]
MSKNDSVKQFTTEFLRTVDNNHNIIVRIIGSATDNRWIKGNSDIDILIYIKGKMDKNFEKKIIRLYFRLDEKYKTQIQSTPFFHPPIIFIRNRLEDKLTDNILKKNKARRQTVKALLKRIMPPIRILVPFITNYGKHINIAFLIFLFIISHFFYTKR